VRKPEELASGRVLGDQLVDGLSRLGELEAVARDERVREEIAARSPGSVGHEIDATVEIVGAATSDVRREGFPRHLAKAIEVERHGGPMISAPSHYGERCVGCTTMSLHATINGLAAQFAHDLLRAFRGASFQDILAETSAGHARRGPGRPRAAVAGGEVRVPFRGKRTAKRLARRSLADITTMAERIVVLVKSSKKGINAEGIKRALKIERRELPRPLGLALKSKKIHKRGRKRATMYFA
jgi:hypothetical protein